jgi:hypothetical protein
MNLEPAPRLPKWTFFAIDAGLLIAAFIIVFFNSKNPYAPLPFVSAVICVVLAAVIGVIPFLIDYAADSAEYVQQERVRVNEQVQRLHAAGESLARAAAQIKAVEEAVHKTAHAAENLPYRMQEKLAEFNAALAETEESDRAALEEELDELRAANSDKLKTLAEKIHQTTAEWSALEASTRKQLAAAEAAVAKVQHSAGDAAGKFEAKLTAALVTLDEKISQIEKAAAMPIPAAAIATPVAAVADRRHETSTPEVMSHHSSVPAEPEPAAIIESVTLSETSPALEEARTKKPRAPRKLKHEDSHSASELNTPRDEEKTFSNGFALSEEAESDALSATTDRTESFRAEASEAAASSDGATRLLVTAYIGIGNKLFIRGEGPGLSWSKGIPMHFVSIGKWGWATNDASGPVRCELYKNDESAALTGEVIVDPGKHVEVTALF